MVAPHLNRARDTYPSQPASDSSSSDSNSSDSSSSDSSCSDRTVKATRLRRLHAFVLSAA